ncbi:cell division protein FtsL [Staphylococcus auricularis]|uniref:Cell division protein FtsL n=1 Tax=Staphylococcus auricularis TaxID=29379 RepID=A0AAP8TTW7_9STAP|nr:cell division protein FtsL [Staphylococcus auricularis]MBM0867639.1 cell division protein FtsL [Staphylococcus auricularis]MCE5037827.1 cell division protein FtsL [Staphylococcus auricularis]MCG7340505.1 cell division protein FtsL [Staphylococcus auricularis]MDC6326457.1 cell division protein FtsL [Staphylococcus auricularis]MDN4532334.1 cell division protein FtsL [Staphylococcus auricularis]
MAVEKVYQTYNQAEQQPTPETRPSTEKQTVTKKVVVGLTKFEKMLYISLITVIALISIYMLSLKMDAYDTRGKIADLDTKIEQQASENSALESEIKKNSSYERIYEKAKDQGMGLKNDNVKVVRNNGEAKN